MRAVLERLGLGAVLVGRPLRDARLVADTAEVAQARLYDRWATFGLALLVLGFVLQVIGSWPR